MSDDFGTVNVRRGDRSREIETLRQRYRSHRDTLVRLAADAPSEHLAIEYQRLADGIDGSMRKLDELGLPITDSSTSRPSPGNQPLVNSLQAEDALPPVADGPLAASGSSARILLIVVAGLVVLGLIGWLIWRASSDRKEPSAILERSTTSQRSESTQTREVAPVVEPESPAALKVKPATADYGTIRKGTRAVRQFEVTNVTDAPLTLEVARSTCRCLYYDYHPKIAAKGHETVTVTVDGARAKAGVLDQQVTVKTKEKASVEATLGIHAMIK